MSGIVVAIYDSRSHVTISVRDRPGRRSVNVDVAGSLRLGSFLDGHSRKSRSRISDAVRRKRLHDRLAPDIL